MKKLVFALCVFSGLITIAQVSPTVWEPEAVKRPVPLPYLRQADIAWSKRIWRVVDLREKFNQIYYYPLQPTAGTVSLFDVLRKGIYSNKITAYSTIDDEFSSRYSTEDIRKKLVKQDTVVFYETDDKGMEHEVKTVINDSVSSADIIQYWIKEDFFFDSKRSVLDVRITGICPVKYDKDKELLVPLFWVNFPQCRELFAASKAINPFNDKEQLTYDDLFLKRMFHSYISKESNVFDRNITEYAKGIDALEESKKINEQLRNYECDLWQY